MESGQVIAERFRLERELGRGGMGSVWRAHHLSLDVACAIKFIEGDDSTMPELRARFAREARAAAKLKSPNAVSVLDHGEWQGTPYLVMELLEGEDLAARLARVGRLPDRQLVQLLRGVARALDRAHSLGIVHRDMKPENVFLVREAQGDVPKVVDFGIAKMDGLGANDAKTRTGALLGTPYYMSPEQAEGTGVIDWRTDVWALGVIAFEAHTGRLPFDGETLGDLLLKIMVKPIVVPSQLVPGVSETFDRFWARASQRDPALRFQSAGELVGALAAALRVTLPEDLEAGVERPPPSSLSREDMEIASMRTIAANTPLELGTLGGQSHGATRRSAGGRRGGLLFGLAAAVVGIGLGGAAWWGARARAATTEIAAQDSQQREGLGAQRDEVRPAQHAQGAESGTIAASTPGAAGTPDAAGAATSTSSAGSTSSAAPTTSAAPSGSANSAAPSSSQPRGPLPGTSAQRAAAPSSSAAPRPSSTGRDFGF